MMKLYGFDMVNPRKACAVAKYLQTPIDYVRVDLGRGEHRRPDCLALNPNGKLPTLADGTCTLREADAIMCHLAARADSELWPQEDRQIEVIRWLSWNLAHFYKCGGTLAWSAILLAATANVAPAHAASHTIDPDTPIRVSPRTTQTSRPGAASPVRSISRSGISNACPISWPSRGSEAAPTLRPRSTAATSGSTPASRSAWT